MTEKASQYLTNSVLRAARILESFSPEKPSYTNSELSRKLSLNKSTVTRLLYSLEKAGFLERDRETGQYTLTYKLFQIGSVYIQQINLPRIARPHLSQLAALCNETAHLSVFQDFEVLYIERVPCLQPIRMMSRIGSRLPAYCTGMGKVFLADLEEERLNDFFRSVEMKPFTANTITRPDELKRHLRRIRDQGYAVDNREREPEVKSIAAPVRGRTGRVVAAISVAGPTYRISEEKLMKTFAPAVMEAALMISQRLGFMVEGDRSGHAPDGGPSSRKEAAFI